MHGGHPHAAGRGRHDPVRDAAVRRVLLVEGAMNLLVLVAKLFAGFLTGSLALLSDALHSLTDLGNNVIAFLVMRHAGRPPDHNHPYGHRKFETLAVFTLAMLLVVLAVELILRAVVGERTPTVSSALALVVVAGGVVVNLLVSLWERRKARQLRSDILAADATHTLADVLTTVVVVVGWQLGAAGHAWAETIATLGVAAFVLFLSFGLFRRAVPILVDEGAVDPGELRATLGEVAGVREVRRVRSRRLGDRAFADVVVAVDDHLSTEDGHDIADRVEDVLAEVFRIHDVTVHLEPVGSKASGGGSPVRRLPLLLASLLLALPSCGGGGGSAGGPPPPPANAQQIVQDIVTGCVESSLDQVLALRTVLEAAAAGGQTPDFRTTGVSLSNPSQPALQWAGDLDGDTIDDVTGTSRLGGLTLIQMAALVAQLSAPGADLQAVLSTLPTGTTVDSDFVATQPGMQAVGDVLIVLANPTGSQPLPDTTTGSIVTDDGVCEVTWSWTQLTVAALFQGPYPVADLDMGIVAPTGNVTGVLHMDGTSTALLETRLLPSGFESDFSLDLDTGVLTPL